MASGRLGSLFLEYELGEVKLWQDENWTPGSWTLELTKNRDKERVTFAVTKDGKELWTGELKNMMNNGVFAYELVGVLTFQGLMTSVPENNEEWKTVQFNFPDALKESVIVMMKWFHMDGIVQEMKWMLENAPVLI